MSQPHVVSGAPVRAPVAALPAPKAIAAAKPQPALAPVKAAERHLEKPAMTAMAKPSVTSVPKSEPPHVKAAEAATPAPVRTAMREPTTIKSDAAPVATVATTAPAPASEDAAPEFRWPARGRIIQGFKAGQSEGINIAVPEGTAVKAAEGGTVAYAGSELKGYGNLVLIRHPNGFVSAYAHNGELLVKRGETVKRGQVIAKSGQSGNVSSPQLQFQLRKGSTPVDPTQYLAGL
jgi:murein DD-endopeptidase MepM/ murein hydrolase activator NlpD